MNISTQNQIILCSCFFAETGYRCLIELHQIWLDLREVSRYDIYNCISGPPPLEIIFSNRHEIRRLNVSEKSYVSLVSGLRNTIALDFYYNKSSALTASPGDGSQVFWTDVVDDKIYAGTMIANCK